MSNGKRIPTNLRTILILETVGNSDTALSPTEINEHLGLPKQTVHRLVATLEREGLLRRETDKNKFRPGCRAFVAGIWIAACLPHRDFAPPDFAACLRPLV